MRRDNARLTQGEVDAGVRRGMALIARQLRRARREFGVGIAGTTAYAIATVASSYVVGWVTDDVLIPSVRAGSVTVAALAVAAVAVIGVSGVRAVGIAFRRIGAYRAQYRLQATDRIELTDRMLDLPLRWHRRHPTGELLSYVNADVEAASSIAAPLPMAFGVVLMLLITGVLLIVTDPFLALIGLMVGPAIALSNVGYQRSMRRVVAQAQQLRAEVSEIAHESFDGALVVKTLGRESLEVDRFGSRSEDLRDRMVHVGRLRAVFDPLMEALPNLGIIAVLFVGARRVAEGVISAGTLVTFAYLFRLVALPMRVFAWLLADLPRAVIGWRRISDVVSTDDEVRYGESRLTGVRGASTAAERLRFRYPGESRGIESIDLDIPAGATVALVGPTGSGKSTVGQLMIRLFDPESGRVTIDDVDVAALDRHTLTRTAALVFQEAFLFNDTVTANITLGEPLPPERVEAAARVAQAHDFVVALPSGYDTLLGERGATLSGGQRQRIALARALARQPRLLVLDDATSAVDPAVEAAILDGLGSLDTTVLIVAHRRSSILLADHVVYVEDGSVVGSGTHEQLYRRVAGYRELIDAYEESA